MACFNFTSPAALELVLPLKRGMFLDTGYSVRGLNRVWWHYTKPMQEVKFIEAVQRSDFKAGAGERTPKFQATHWIRMFQQTVLLAVTLRNLNDVTSMADATDPLVLAHDAIFAKFHANVLKLGLSEQMMWDIIDGDARMRAAVGLDNLVIEP